MASYHWSKGSLREGGQGQEEALFPAPRSATAFCLGVAQILNRVSLCPRNPPEFPTGRSYPQLNQARVEDSLDGRSGHREEEDAEETPAVKRYAVKLGARAHFSCPLSSLETDNAHDCLHVKGSQTEEVSYTHKAREELLHPHLPRAVRLNEAIGMSRDRVCVCVLGRMCRDEEGERKMKTERQRESSLGNACCFPSQNSPGGRDDN